MTVQAPVFEQFHVLRVFMALCPFAGRQSLSLHRFAAGARGWGLLNRLMRLYLCETCFVIAAAKKVTKESSYGLSGVRT
jgi:hypothetical protein